MKNIRLFDYFSKIFSRKSTEFQQDFNNLKKTEKELLELAIWERDQIGFVSSNIPELRHFMAFEKYGGYSPFENKIYLNLIEPGNDEQIIKLKACISKLSSYCITSDLDKILAATNSPETLFEYGINSDGVDYYNTNEKYIKYLIATSVNLRKLESARYDTIHEELDHANAPKHIRQSLNDNYSNLMDLIFENRFNEKYKQHIKDIIELEASAKFFAHIRSSGYKMPSIYSAEALTREQMWSYLIKYLAPYKEAIQHFIIRQYVRSTPEAFLYSSMIDKAMVEPALIPEIYMQFNKAGLPIIQIIEDLDSGYRRFCQDAEVHLNQTIKNLSEKYYKILS